MGLLTAWAFLTRLPGGRHPDDGDVSGSVVWFPLVGLVIGALGAAVYVGASELVPATSAAVLAFAATALATGGLHEDGLADTMDGLLGGWDREHRLAILKDSRQGTFGVLALVVITLLKVTALAPLSGWDAVAALVVAHVVGRSAAVAMMAGFPSAREGLGASYSRAISWPVGLVAALMGVAAAIVGFGLDAWIVLGVVAIATVLVGMWSRHKIGGVTGDILGAGEQVAEVCVLLVAAGLLHTG